MTIPRDQRPVRVLLNVDEYERLKAFDARQSFYPHDLSDDLKAEIDKGFQGAPTPALDHLMK